MIARTLIVSIFLLVSGVAFAEPPDDFAKAKRIARDVIYAGHPITIYCGCSYKPKGTSGGIIDAASCELKARKNKTRALRLEWEHAAPASWFGHLRACWTKGAPACVSKTGKPYRGRQCCEKADEWFRKAEADLYNLFPSSGEVNGDRSDKPYGEIEDEPRAYGACDFEVSKSTAEPSEAVRGDLARAVLYMDETYGPFLTDTRRTLYQKWSETDPPDAWEIERAGRIKAVMGH